MLIAGSFATADDCYPLLQRDSLIVGARLNEQGVTRLAVVDAKTNGSLSGLPTLAVLTIMPVRAYIPRSR